MQYKGTEKNEERVVHVHTKGKAQKSVRERQHTLPRVADVSFSLKLGLRYCHMIDSHAHVAFEQFDTDRKAVIERAQQAGVHGWIEVGTDISQSHKAIALAQQHDHVWATVGVHPSDIDTLKEQDWERIEKLLREKKVVAVGEVGLDLYRGGNLDHQRNVLKRFISVAQSHHLPVIFHVRNGQTVDVHEELLNLLESYAETDRPRGVIHTYSGTAEQAKRYISLGMYLSFSGVITFKNAQDTAEIARVTSLEKILIETDCPFLAPMPYRGKRNEPAYVASVAHKIAELKEVSVTTIQQETENNTRRLFGVS